jgi:integrase
VRTSRLGSVPCLPAGSRPPPTIATAACTPSTAGSKRKRTSQARWGKMKPPVVPDQPIPVLGEPQLRALFAVCAGKDFDARRDTALLVDAGPRRAELLGMHLADLNFEYDVVRLLGKGGRERALPFGRTTAMALDRYLRARSRHRLAHLDALWLASAGRSPSRGFATCSTAAPARPASRPSIRICSRGDRIAGTLRCGGRRRSGRRQKPHPDGVLRACERLGVPAQAAADVADAPIDLEAARANARSGMVLLRPRELLGLLRSHEEQR